jgi:hypothetical protein
MKGRHQGVKASARLLRKVACFEMAIVWHEAGAGVRRTGGKDGSLARVAIITIRYETIRLSRPSG